MPTSDELEAWRQQPMYDGEPFSQDRQFEVATAAFLGDATYELHTYASVYMENWGLDLQLEMPTPEKLARWVHDEQCPHAELVISEERLQRLFQGQARWFTLADDTGTAMAVLLGPTEDFSLGRFIDVFRLWREATEEFRTAWRHPLAPLMKAWFASRPRPADASTREKERIIPAQVAMAPPGDRRAGKLFSVAAHVEHGPDGQLVMPGFQLDRQAPALPLALYDLGLEVWPESHWPGFTLRQSDVFQAYAAQ